MSSNLWSTKVKQYYTRIERYDWVEVTSRLKGVESIFHWNRMRVMLKLFTNYHYGMPVLDAGCGTGLILRGLPPMSIGLDINPWGISKAKIHAPLAQFIIADVEKMPFKEASIRTVICTEVIEHIPHPELAMSEIRKVLGKNGRFIGSMPHRTLLWGFRVLSSTCPHAEPFHNQYSLHETVRLLKEFKIMLIRLSTLRLNIVFVTQKSG